MDFLYLGPDATWAYGALTAALGADVEAAKSEADAVHLGSRGYEMVFFDLTNAVDSYWQPVVARLWHQGLKVIVVSPKPEWRETLTAIGNGATHYIEKTDVIADLAREIAKARAFGVPRRR